MRVPLRCLLIDDSVEFGRAVAALLKREGVEVVAVADSGAEGLRRARTHRPDLIVLDVELGAENGFDVARDLLAGGIAAPVIFISVCPEYADVVADRPAVLGFLSKDALSGEAVRQLWRGGAPAARAFREVR